MCVCVCVCVRLLIILWDLWDIRTAYDCMSVIFDWSLTCRYPDGFLFLTFPFCLSFLHWPSFLVVVVDVVVAIVVVCLFFR